MRATSEATVTTVSIEREKSTKGSHNGVNNNKNNKTSHRETHFPSHGRVCHLIMPKNYGNGFNKIPCRKMSYVII